MEPKTRRTLGITLLCALLWGQTAQASNRWDILSWCTATTAQDGARCQGFLYAAVDLTTGDDFPGPKACFRPDTRLPQVRQAVVIWLKQNRVAVEQSGLALVTRAIRERFPCPD